VESLAGGEGEVECRPLSDLSFRPDLAAVGVNAMPHHRQANPGSRDFLTGVQTLKGTKSLSAYFISKPVSAGRFLICNILFYVIKP
jgi:hypothetical protein